MSLYQDYQEQLKLFEMQYNNGLFDSAINTLNYFRIEYVERPLFKVYLGSVISELELKLKDYQHGGKIK